MKFSATSFQFASISYSTRRGRPATRRAGSRRGAAGQVAELGRRAVGAAGSRQTNTSGPKLSTRTGCRPWSALSNASTSDMSNACLLVVRDAGESGVNSGVPRQRAVEVVRPRVVRALEEALDVPLAGGAAAARRGAGTRCGTRAARRPGCGTTTTERPATSTTR